MSLGSIEDRVWRDHNGPLWHAIEDIARLCGAITSSTRIAAGQAPAPTILTEAAGAANRLDHHRRRAA